MAAIIGSDARPAVPENVAREPAIADPAFGSGAWIEQLRIDAGGIADYHRIAVDLQVETTASARVTRDAVLIHEQQHRIGVAIKAHTQHLLCLSGGFAFAPQRLPAAGKIRRLCLSGRGPGANGKLSVSQW